MYSENLNNVLSEKCLKTYKLDNKILTLNKYNK